MNLHDRQFIPIEVVRWMPDMWRFFLLLLLLFKDWGYFPHSTLNPSLRKPQQKQNLPFGACGVLLRKFSVNAIYFLFYILVSSSQFLIYNMRNFGLDLKCLKNSDSYGRRGGQGLWSQMLVDSKFRSKLQLFCFLVELEHSPDFTSGGNLLPPPELA